MDKYSHSLNNERLKRYKTNIKAGKQDIINLYSYNIKLSKELYPLISLFEVALRNHVSSAISKNISSNWFLDYNITKNILKDKELKNFFEAYQNLSKKGNLSEGRLIAELNLGFWVNLFNKKYKINLWHKKNMFESVFPYFNIKTSNRVGYIYPKLKEVQYIRNRISHHEAIFDYPKGLNNFYKDILFLLNCLSPEIKDLATGISDFPTVWEEINVYTGK